MPRVVPSQVIAFINGLWPSSGDLNNLQRGQAGQLSGLVDLLDQIPNELLIMDTAAYASFVCGKAHIKQKLLGWVAVQDRGHELGQMPGPTPKFPVAEIRDALAKCPDESPVGAASALNFIADVDLRRSLLIDIGAVTRALSNGEWKAATVLAGSAIEALLLWDLQNRRQATFPAAVTALVANGTFQQQPSHDPEEWSLHHYVEVEAYLGIINQDTATETRLAKQFRNLIHPGRAQRLGQKYDRGTALSSVAALSMSSGTSRKNHVLVERFNLLFCLPQFQRLTGDDEGRKSMRFLEGSQKIIAHASFRTPASRIRRRTYHAPLQSALRLVPGRTP